MALRQKSLLRFIFGLIVLMSFVFLLVSDLAAQEEGCHTSVSRLARFVAPLAKLNPVLATALDNSGTPIDVSLESNPISDNSIEEHFSPQWKLNLNDGDRIDFFYRDTPSILSLKINSDQSDSEIEINLPRRESGEWMDVNLLGPFFEHIYLKAQAGETFKIVINDPTFIKKLNDLLEEILREMKFYGHAAQAETYAASNPMGEYYSYDPNIESYFPVLDSVDSTELFRSLRDEDLLSRVLKDELIKNPLFKTLEVSPFLGWKIDIDIEGFDLRSKLLQQGVETEESGLRPYVFQYVIRITAE